MIFVTVGTHEQQFNRLIQEMDNLVGMGIIQDEVFMQIGYSSYRPINTDWDEVINYEKMKELEDKADLIITHGGPATFMSVLAKGKIPIVVPRLVKYGEHVNDHQLDFAKKVMNHGYKIFLVENIDALQDIIRKVDQEKVEIASNNAKFVKDFEKILDNLIEN